MKTRITILTTSLILALLLLLPASIALAAPPAPTLVNPPAGSTVANAVTFQWTAGGGPNYVLELTNLSTAVVSTIGGIAGNSYSISLTTGPWSWRVQDATPSWSASQTFSVVAPSIWLNPSQGYSGTVFTITGYSWQPWEIVRVYYDGVLQQTLNPASATWTVTLTASGALGYHTITATGTVSGSQAGYFKITGPPPYLTQSTTQDSPGSLVTIAGFNFNPSEIVHATFAGSVIVSGTANSAGSWSLSFIIPEKPAGSYAVDAYGSTTTASVVPDLSFFIRPILTANPTSVEVKAQISISGKGFRASSPISLSYSSDTVAGAVLTPISTNALGSFSATIPAPTRGGNYVITASDGVYSTTTGFTVANPISMVISPTTGAVGEEVTVTGNNMGPGTITFTYDGVTIGSTKASADGSFSLSLTIPKSSAGYHILTATDSAGNTINVPFTMESTPPPAPTLIKPDERSNEGWTSADVTFKWSGVTDPSGVTYNLIVARDPSRAVVILNITGLTTPEYQAQLTGQGTYYWFAQAVDGAGNRSEWLSARSFVIDYPIPVWSMWAIGGSGLALVIVIVLLVIFGSKRRPL